jgi:hypothetical protein
MSTDSSTERVRVHVHAGRQDRSADGAAEMTTPAQHHRVQRLAAAVVVVEDELRRRQRLGPAQDRPLAVVEVELGLDRDEVHVRVEEGVERPDVAPVAALDLGCAPGPRCREVVDLRLAALDERGTMLPPMSCLELSSSASAVTASISACAVKT